MKYKRLWVLITAILISIVAFLASQYWSNLSTIFIGVGASITATLLFWILTDVLQDNSERQYLTSIIERMEHLEELNSEFGLHGLSDIFKRDNTNKFWIGFVKSAENKLTLSGRTQVRWLENKKRQKALKKALKRVAKKKTTVDPYDEPIRLIIYSDDGLIQEADRIGVEKLGAFIAEKEKIKEFLYGIWKGFSSEERDNLAVYEVDVLPYFYCNNGKLCVTGTYFYNRSEKMNLQFVFKCGGNSVEREYTEDFNMMLRKAKKVKIEEWQKNNTEVVMINTN
jgi:hypothetical protein